LEIPPRGYGKILELQACDQGAVMTQSSEQKTERAEPKRPYSPPELRSYGTIDDITAVKPRGVADGPNASVG
jgi:hypothetical protein